MSTFKSQEQIHNEAHHGAFIDCADPQCTALAKRATKIREAHEHHVACAKELMQAMGTTLAMLTLFDEMNGLIPGLERIKLALGKYEASEKQLQKANFPNLVKNAR